MWPKWLPLCGWSKVVETFPTTPLGVTMARTTRLLASLAALSFIVASCGGSDSSSDTTAAGSAETQELTFRLEPAIIGGKMFLSDLYFRPGAAFLLPASERALEGILSFMQYNDHLRFEIGGHINRPNEEAVPIASSSFKLSEARAKTVKDYLVSKSVTADNLSTKGYGKSNPVGDNATTKGRAANRRIQIKLVK